MYEQPSETLFTGPQERFALEGGVLISSLDGLICEVQSRCIHY
jgi:hypothetical protein